AASATRRRTRHAGPASASTTSRRPRSRRPPSRSSATGKRSSTSPRAAGSRTSCERRRTSPALRSGSTCARDRAPAKRVQRPGDSDKVRAVAKGEPQLYKPADACRMAEVAPYVLRYWETEFSALSEGKATEKGATRLYTARDVQII